MGSFFDITTCPKCGHETFSAEYYYNTGEEYSFCSCCGYSKDTIKEEGYAEKECRVEDIMTAITYTDYSAHEEHTEFTKPDPDDLRVLFKDLSKDFFKHEYGKKADGSEDLNKSIVTRFALKDGDGYIFATAPYKYDEETDTVTFRFPRYKTSEKGGYGVAYIREGQVRATYPIEPDVPSMAEEAVKIVQETGEGYVTVVKNGEVNCIAGEETFKAYCKE